MMTTKKVIQTPLRLFSSSSVTLTRAQPSIGSQKKLSKEQKLIQSRREYRFAYPEFLPDPDPRYRNATRELLERQDMIQRRNQTSIPEFYVGSIVAVTTTIFPAQREKGESTENRFVGIVIDRGGSGLKAWIVVRNVLNGSGVEFMYDLYAPTIKEVEVLRLEKRLDDELYYLRDADLKYSTVPTDMLAEQLPAGQPCPLNDIVVPIPPGHWSQKWEKFTDRLFGFEISDPDKMSISQHKKMKARKSYLGIVSISIRALIMF